MNCQNYLKKISDIERPNKQNLEDICYQSVKNIF